jgi:hypothetical protein
VSNNTEAFTLPQNFTPDSPDPMQMNTNILGRHLVTERNNMKTNKDSDYSSSVLNPFGIGYAPPLSEARNLDAKEIQMQENTMFALGAITGVSLIVAGLLLASSSDVTPTTPAP